MISQSSRRLAQLTQRLDHMVPDRQLTAAENQTASANLVALSERLQALLPDPSLSPDERLERLARVVVGRSPQLENLQPAASKLDRLTKRLNELVPGDGDTSEQLEALVQLLNDSVPPFQADDSIQTRLERLGDPRTEQTAD